MATQSELGPTEIAGLNVKDVVSPAKHEDAEHAGEKARLSTNIARDSFQDPESQAGSIGGDVVDHERYPPPTEEERKTLRKVADSIPHMAWLICIVELAERASYYGAKTVFNNYIQFPLPEDGPGTGAINPNNPNDHAGALGLGLQASSALTLLFTFLAYVIPIGGAWWADVKVGKWNAIVWGVIICGVAHVIMIGGAAPALLQRGQGVAPFVVSLLLLAFGAGLFKPNISPTLIDQYTYQREYVKTLKSGERVVVDPETTINRLCLWFYAFVNIGAFFQIPAVYIEKYKGFWQAFLAPGVIYFLLPVLLAATYKKMVRVPPQGSDLTRFTKVTTAAIKKAKFNFWSKTFWHDVKPSTISSNGGAVAPYSEKDVDDAKRTWEAVAIFLYIPIWSINDGGVGSVSSNQGAAMTTQGVPNDLINNFNPLVIIFFSPFMAQIVYPFLRGRGYKLGPVTRMLIGFFIATLSGIAGAIVQYYVYKTSPCGYYASTCDEVSPLSIWLQIPNVALGAISEVFVFTTGYEMAYARAPPHMRATVTALFLFMTALASALGEILLPALEDPNIVWGWAAPAIALAAQSVIFWFRYRHVDTEAYMTHEEDYATPKAEQKPEAVNEKRETEVL